MSKRTERRDAERAARKASYKQLRQQRAQGVAPAAIEAPIPAPELNHNEASLAKANTFSEAEPTPVEAIAQPAAVEPAPVSKKVSEAQLAANRANAQLSTGPTTPEGQARSSMNALKHGLTGKTVLLPHEDPAEYQHQLNSFISAHQPATEDELRLVQSIVDCLWRIDRIMHLETAILLKGQLECSAKFEDRSAFERSHLINAEAYLKYERQLRNLNIQEARLRRTMEKDKIELTRLQAIRHHQEQFHLAAQLKAQKAPVQPENGFEFLTPPNQQAATNKQHHQPQKRAA